MKPVYRAVLALCLALGTFAAAAEEPPCLTTRQGATVCPAPGQKCLKNRRGDVLCSRPAGGIAFDRNGEPVCGVGRCTIDARGNTVCSTTEGGAASVNAQGGAECSGSCAPAAAAACSVVR